MKISSRQNFSRSTTTTIDQKNLDAEMLLKDVSEELSRATVHVVTLKERNDALSNEISKKKALHQQEGAVGALR